LDLDDARSEISEEEAELATKMSDKNLSADQVKVRKALFIQMRTP
jgi:hypothetical protein